MHVVYTEEGITFEWDVLRRYSSFEKFYKLLKKKYKGNPIILNKLKSHFPTQKIRGNNSKFVFTENRRQSLELFLIEVNKVPIISRSIELNEFVQVEENLEKLQRMKVFDEFTDNNILNSYENVSKSIEFNNNISNNYNNTTNNYSDNYSEDGNYNYKPQLEDNYNNNNEDENYIQTNRINFNPPSLFPKSYETGPFLLHIIIIIYLFYY